VRPEFELAPEMDDEQERGTTLPLACQTQWSRGRRRPPPCRQVSTTRPSRAGFVNPRTGELADPRPALVNQGIGHRIPEIMRGWEPAGR
jgi:hypothetical protein